MKGVYALLIELEEPREVTVTGRLKFAFSSGCYVYVGSALNSLESRVARHFRPEKKCHWHIDRLLAHGVVRQAVCAETKGKLECVLARALSEVLPGVPRFGSSDCKCSSHLFYSAKYEAIKNITLTAFRQVNLSPFLIEGRASKLKATRFALRESSNECGLNCL